MGQVLLPQVIALRGSRFPMVKMIPRALACLAPTQLAEPMHRSLFAYENRTPSMPEEYTAVRRAQAGDGSAWRVPCRAVMPLFTLTLLGAAR